MAPSRDVGIIIKFASKPSSVIVAGHAKDDVLIDARDILVIDIRNGTCLIKSSFSRDDDIYCDFDEINNQLTIYNKEGISGFFSGNKAIVIPLYSKDLP